MTQILESLAGQIGISPVALRQESAVDDELSGGISDGSVPVLVEEAHLDVGHRIADGDQLLRVGCCPHVDEVLPHQSAFGGAQSIDERTGWLAIGSEVLQIEPGCSITLQSHEPQIGEPIDFVRQHAEDRRDGVEHRDPHSSSPRG